MRVRIALCLLALAALPAAGYAQDKPAPATGTTGQESKNTSPAPSSPSSSPAAKTPSPQPAAEKAKSASPSETKPAVAEHHKHAGVSKSRRFQRIDPNWRAKWLAEQEAKAAQARAEKAQAAQQESSVAKPVGSTTPTSPSEQRAAQPAAINPAPPAAVSAAKAGGTNSGLAPAASTQANSNPPAAAKPAQPTVPPPPSVAKNSPQPAVTPVTNVKPAPANTATSPKPAAKAPTGKSAETLFDQTKPDSIAPSASGDRPQESPMAAMGDAWKMLLYLVPMLLLIVGALRLLRRFQERNGRLPGPVQTLAQRSGRTHAAPKGSWLQSLMGGMNSNASRQSEGSIRLVETLGVGGASLHLIQVRGRLLLLGSAGGEVRVLTEFKEQEGVAADDFRMLLQTAAADIDSLDFGDDELPATTLVGSLDSAMRDTGSAMSRRLRRLRTVQEAEEAGE